MALSLERIIWYDFNGFPHVEIFGEEPFFSAKKLLDERWALGGGAYDNRIRVSQKTKSVDCLSAHLSIFFFGGKN
jgi:hypothetical protein